MKSLHDLLIFYRDELLEDLGELELQRRMLRWRIIGGIVFALAAFAMGIIAAAMDLIPTWAGVIGALAGAVIGVIFSATQYEGFRHRYKERICAPLLHFLDPSFKYDPAGRIDDEEIKQTRLLPELWNKYTGEDLITGRLGSRPFRMSEVRLLRNESAANGGNNETEEIDYFEGVVVALERGRSTHVPVWFRTFREPQARHMGARLEIGEHFSKLGEAIDFPGHDADLAIEVRAGDAELARELVAPELSQKLHALADMLGGQVYGAFMGERFYLAAESPRNYFEPRVWEKLVQREEIEAFHADFSALLDAAAAAP